MRTRLAAGAAAAASMIVLLGAPVAAAYAPASAAGAVQVAGDPGDEDPVNGPAGMSGDPEPAQPGAFPGQEQNTMPGDEARPGETPKQQGNNGLLGGGGKGGLLGLGLLGL
ncbi:hypothetical protein ABT381_17165 [Streptomyces sp. NPDC000151]|uniref:hypothetical protein n=1 Tax=Streptomyces sp. NPDC000151 TaxID=3154244 RepID=UPI0033318234